MIREWKEKEKGVTFSKLVWMLAHSEKATTRPQFSQVSFMKRMPSQYEVWFATRDNLELEAIYKLKDFRGPVAFFKVYMKKVLIKKL